MLQCKTTARQGSKGKKGNKLFFFRTDLALYLSDSSALPDVLFLQYPALNNIDRSTMPALDEEDRGYEADDGPEIQVLAKE